MDALETVDRPAKPVAQSSETNCITNSSDALEDKEKQVAKLTAKVFAEKLERLLRKVQGKLR